MMRSTTRAVLSMWFLACAAATATAADPAWVGSWAASPMIQDGSTFSAPPQLSGKILRQVVRLSAGGSAIRVRLDNTFGEKAMQIRSVLLGTSIEGAPSHPAAFGGDPSLTITSGAAVWSDPVPLPVQAGTDLQVIIEFGDAPANVTGHSDAQTTSSLSDAPAPATQPAPATSITHWFVLDGVDVQAPDPQGTIVAFGDSITDGYKSTPDANHRWPDALARRIAADPGHAGIGVVNEGISGNRLTDNRYGPSALARFDRDVLAQTHARWIVLLEGINDIGTDPHPQNGDLVKRLEFADEQIVARAHAHGLKVYAATILPFVGAMYASPEKEKNRLAVNDWIRTTGLFDAVIDFDARTRDPANPSTLLPAYDSGDHLHPNDAGYQHMADSVDLKLFTR